MTKKTSGDHLRSKNWTNRELNVYSKVLEDIRILEDLERFKTRLSKKAEANHPNAKQSYSNLAKKAPQEITDINYKFEHGDGQGYTLEFLAQMRPNFLLDKVIQQLDENGQRKYIVSEEIAAQVVGMIMHSKCYRDPPKRK